MGRPEDVASDFAAYVSIGELENILSLNKNFHIPPFLRRNLPYAARQPQVQREERATHCVKVTFETMKTMERYGAARIPLIVSLCTTVAGPGGGEAYVPIVARVVWVPAPIPGGPPRQVTAVLPVSLPYCMMPPDMVVMVLHRGEQHLARLMQFSLHGSHRPEGTLVGGKSATCNVTDTRIFYWLPANATVLYHKIQCIEDLGIQGAQRGIMELQPGRALSHHARGQGATPRCPSSFSIAIEEIGEVTPMFRYTLSVEERDVSGRKRKRLDDGLPPLAPIVPFAGVQSQVNGAEPMVTVSFCTEDGRHRAVARVPGYVCPLESCGMRCRDFKGLQHHLATSHLYYECGSFMGSAGPQIYIRCKKAYFRPDGTFLPRAIVGVPGDHGLWDLLFKTPYNLPFQYYCPPEERRRRLYPQATIPSDERDRELEARALVQAEQEWAEVLRLEEVRREADRPAASEPTSMTGSEAGGGKGGRPAQVKGRARGRDGQGAVNGSRLQRPLNIPLLTPDGRPKFYHGKTCVAMTATELREGEDSDDESDTEEWLRDCVERLEERPSLCPEERDFMLQWNLYLHQNTLHADADVPAACSSFAREHGAQLADARGPFRRCFMAHLCNLWKFRLLTPVQFQEVLAAVKAAGPAAAS